MSIKRVLYCSLLLFLTDFCMVYLVNPCDIKNICPFSLLLTVLICVTLFLIRIMKNKYNLSLVFELRIRLQAHIFFLYTMNLVSKGFF